MKTLYILRHGQAVSDGEAPSDRERDLTPGGERAALRVGAHLAGLESPPSLVLASSAVRARRTAELCISRFASLPASVVTDELYLAAPEAYLKVLAAHGGEHAAVMVVGHNPGLEALVLALTGRSEHLATAALVCCELPLPTWRELRGGARGRLIEAWHP